MSKADAAQLIAGLAIVLLTLILAIVGRRDLVAQEDVAYTLPDGTVRKIAKGGVVPAAQAASIQPQHVRSVKRSWLGAILVGADHRTSTSKTVAFAWTLTIAFGLLSLLVAVWLGDRVPWDLQVDKGLQEEYLLLLGGPYAAAILAKYAAVGQSAAKTAAPVGDAGPAQLVNDDTGGAELGDFQYVLFNAIGLAFFLGDFIGHLSRGFPALPPLLTGLVLTSTGGYAAKKLLAQATPTLTSVLPASALPGAVVKVFGTNLSVPASASQSGEELGASVFAGRSEATVTAHELVLGNDCLTVTIAADAPPGSAPITAVRADGVPASGPGGANALAFEVLAKP